MTLKLICVFINTLYTGIANQNQLIFKIKYFIVEITVNTLLLEPPHAVGDGWLHVS